MKKEDLKELFERAKIFGAFLLGEEEEHVSNISINDYEVIHGIVNVEVCYSPTNGVVDGDSITSSKGIKLEELYSFDSIQSLKEYCDDERENQRVKLENDRKIENDKKEQKAEEGRYQLYLELHEEFKNKKRS